MDGGPNFFLDNFRRVAIDTKRCKRKAGDHRSVNHHQKEGTMRRFWTIGLTVLCALSLAVSVSAQDTLKIGPRNP